MSPVDSSVIPIRMLSGDDGAYIDKLAEHPLMTQFNVGTKHLKKDLAVHWPILDDSEWEERAQVFLLGPIKSAIENFAHQNDYQDVLVTLWVTDNADLIVLPDVQDAGVWRFETEKGSGLILMCQESPWHASTAFGDYGYVTQLDGDEDVYRVTERFLNEFYSRNTNLFSLGAQDAFRRSLIRMHQYGETNLILKQELYSMFVALGLISGKENVERVRAPLIGDIEKNSLFLTAPLIRALEAYALTRAINQTLAPEQRLYFRGLAQQLRITYQPAVKEAALIAAADIDHHHTAHPNAQKAHQDMILRQRDAQRHQTLEPGLDGGGSEG